MAVQGVRRQSTLSRIRGLSDVFLAVGIVGIVGMMIIPVPEFLLDMMLAINIGGALAILMIAIYTFEPLQFSVFPSLLLVMTLFRLALNISATRLILLHGQAGGIIEGFGQFVVGGNYVVGIIMFMILMVIQFVVITNGAGRVAEVSARFKLDAMPGKQMAIDADLNAGTITEAQARKRRKTVEEEADFYGAMDGASKFVRGDAIAAIIIVFVNILGGFAIGILQLGMDITKALQVYTLLTVGEGLVSQIPALLISTASGIMVTRAASDSNLGRDVADDLLRNPKALMITGVVLVILGLVPGFPKLPFLLIGGALAGGSYLLGKGQDTEAREDALALASSESTEQGAPDPGSPEGVVELLQVDPLELEIGYALIPLVDTEQGGNLLSRIAAMRRQIATDLGFVVPSVRVRDNLQLSPNTYSIKLRGVEIAQSELMLNHFLAMNPGNAAGEIDGIETQEPAFGLPALWVTSAERERAELFGYTIVDPGSVLTTHLTEVVKSHAPSILGRQDVQTLLSNIKKDNSALVEEAGGLISVGDIQKVLQNLLRERISIRDLVTILEAVSDAARTTKDTDLLTEFARRALARAISAQYRDESNVIHSIMLAPDLEGQLAQSVQQTDNGATLVLEPGRAQALIRKIATEMERVAVLGNQPLLLCSSRVRLPLRRLVERNLPNLTILSFGEISPQVNVQSSGVVSLGGEMV